MQGGIMHVLSVITISLFINFAKAELMQFLEGIELEELFQSLGPKQLLAEFFNREKTNIFLSDKCSSEINVYNVGLDNKETWARRMLDSSSKIPPGLLSGNVIELGMYDECMSVNVIKNETEIIGNHCTYTLFLSYENKTLPINPMLSICLPLSCKEQDLTEILQKRIRDIGAYETLKIYGEEVLCSTAHSQKWIGTFVTIAIFLGIFFLLLIFTILDLLKEKKVFRTKLPKAVSELSLYTNLKGVFNLEDGSGSISVLHGLRALSTIIIIAGHGVLVKSMSLCANNFEIIQAPVYLNVGAALVIYTVDTFFTISGFLVSYSFLKKYTLSKGDFNLWSYYLHRYIRLTPAIAATLLGSIYIIPFMGSGPKWRKFSKDMLSDVCQEKWWTYLLHVNNLVYENKYCLVHLWSTAVDMQLFWISPLILVPLVKKPKLGLSILSALIFTSIVIPAILVAVNHYSFWYQPEVSFEHFLEMFRNLYIPPYTRASPWLVGIFLGYLVLKTSEELKRTTVIIGWLTTAGCLLFCITGFCIISSYNYKYNVFLESIFNSISRPIWSIAISWIIFASVRNYGGQLTKFLSLPIFIPISRLSFCLYLTHFGIEELNIQTARTPAYFKIYYIALGFVQDIAVTFLVAIFFSIVFEIPARSLENLILKRTPKKHQETKSIEKVFQTGMLTKSEPKLCL